MAGATGLEPATSGVTGRHSNQLSYAPAGAGATLGVAAGRVISRTPAPSSQNGARSASMSAVNHGRGEGPAAQSGERGSNSRGIHGVEILWRRRYQLDQGRDDAHRLANT